MLEITCLCFVPCCECQLVDAIDPFLSECFTRTQTITSQRSLCSIVRHKNAIALVWSLFYLKDIGIYFTISKCCLFFDLFLYPFFPDISFTCMG